VVHRLGSTACIWLVDLGNLGVAGESFLSSALTASAQVSFIPVARVSMKFNGTRSTYAWPSASKCSRNSLQLPYTSSPQ
jgi:hypothetical protein